MARRSNCLFFALYMLWTRGGYLAMRKSPYYWGPHFLWSPDLRRWLHYAPDDTRNPLIRKFLFEGRIRRGDA